MMLPPLTQMGLIRCRCVLTVVHVLSAGLMSDAATKVRLRTSVQHQLVVSHCIQVESLGGAEHADRRHSPPCSAQT
jgi:hypothetical protein